MDFVDEDIRIALTQSGYAYGATEHITFVKSALRDEEWPRGITLRRLGRQLSKEELRSLGYRPNLQITAECLALLTDKGRANPTESTQFIVSAANMRRSSRRDIAQAKRVGIRSVKVFPNNMASGPCPACRALSRTVVKIDDAPCGPLSDCPHPDQCVLHWQSQFNTP